MGKSGKRSSTKLKSFTVSWLEEHTVTVRATDQDQADRIVTDESYDPKLHEVHIDQYCITQNEPMFRGEDLK